MELKTKYINISAGLAMGIIFVMASTPALASTLSFYVVPQKQVIVGDVFPVEIRLDAGGQNINAGEADFNYTKGLVRVDGIRQTGSIFTYWPVDPGYSDIFGVGSAAGGLPDPGFTGKNGLLATVLIEALHPGLLQLSFRPNSKILLNDGKGTPASLQTRPAQVAIAAAPADYVPQRADLIADTVPPDPFTPVITRTPNAFDNKYFAVFSAQDRGSGIDHYEVMEVAGDRASEPAARDFKWRVAESPYLLSNQEGPVTVFVKAIDRRGNIRIEHANLARTAVNKNGFWPQIIVFGLLIVVFLTLKILNWRRPRKNRRPGRTRPK